MNKADVSRKNFDCRIIYHIQSEIVNKINSCKFYVESYEKLLYNEVINKYFYGGKSLWQIFYPYQI